MLHPCPDCGSTTASLATTTWIDIFGAEPPNPGHMELHDIQTDEVSLNCTDCGHPLPLATQADADMLTALFRQLFETHGLNPVRVGRLVIDEPAHRPGETTQESE
ncbi:hypothetical protein [Kitasatospora purpeofusca]|uniref:hypothetical protein n=1 Tax=Kitasatospora purpeofusca TaxID=67352 RepID=UPI0035E1D2BB